MKTKQNKTGMTRRRFIASSAVATFGFQVVPSRVVGANSRLAVAGIGWGVPLYPLFRWAEKGGK